MLQSLDPSKYSAGRRRRASPAPAGQLGGALTTVSDATSEANATEYSDNEVAPWGVRFLQTI
jgi:hypothetical protein